MAHIRAYYQNYVGSSTTRTVVTGPGAIHTIICTCSATTPAQIYLYDNIAGSGNVLLSPWVSAYAPLVINLKDIGPLRFTVGLTIVTPGGANCYVVTEQ